MKLKMTLSIPAREADKVFANESVRIQAVGENSTIIEAECSLQEAVRLAELDPNQGDHSVEIRRG